MEKHIFDPEKSYQVFQFFLAPTDGNKRGFKFNKRLFLFFQMRKC